MSICVKDLFVEIVNFLPIFILTLYFVSKISLLIFSLSSSNSDVSISTSSFILLICSSSMCSFPSICGFSSFNFSNSSFFLMFSLTFSSSSKTNSLGNFKMSYLDSLNPFECKFAKIFINVAKTSGVRLLSPTSKQPFKKR